MSQWHTIGAAVAGVSHHRDQLPCQDAFAYRQLSTGELIVAVADGAGSASHAAAGAALLVTAAVEAAAATLAKYQPLSRQAWRMLIADAFATARNHVLAHAASQAQPARNYAATLVLLILHAEGAACGLVGDCAAVVLDEADQLVSLCVPQRGEYANTTHFVIQPNGLATLELALWEQPIVAAALFSDGLAALAMNIAQNRPFRPFFEPLFAFAASQGGMAETAPATLATFLNSDRVNARTHDDKSLVLVHRNLLGSVTS